jgi:hypothetical protein
LLADSEAARDASDAKRPALAPAPATLAAAPRPSAAVRGLDEQPGNSVAQKPQVAAGASASGRLPESLKRMDLASDALSVNALSEREAGLRGDLAKQTQRSAYNLASDATAQGLAQKESLSQLPSLEILAESRKAGEMDLYAFGFVTSWTNTVHDAAQSWQYFSQNGANLSLAYNDATSANKVSALQDGFATPSAEKNSKKPNAPAADSDFAGGFARPGENTRFPKTKAVGGSVNAPVPAPAPAPSATTGGGGLAGAKTEANSGAANYRPRGFQTPTDPSTTTLGAEVRNGRAENESERRNQPAKILDNFQLVQNGDTIRLVDADGSVYAGTVVAWNEPTQVLRQQVRSEPAAAAPAVERFYRIIEESPTPADANGLQNSNLVRFRVSGTNNTTKELVVVSGQLGRIIAAYKPAASTPSVAEPLEGKKLTEVDKSSVPSVRDPSNFRAQTKSPNDPVRITGLAIVGTNQIRLDAIRR